jgi:beta-lactamase regulating signal transducer with metallopeptidase domain
MSTPGADAFAGVLTQVLVHGTVLATMTWLLCAVFLRRVRPAVHVVLWTVVLLKFLIPPVFPGLVSLSGWLSSASSSLGFSGSGGSAQGVIVLEESLDLTAVAAPGGSFSFFESLASWLSANLSALALFVYVTILGLLVVRSAVRTLKVAKYVRGLPLASPGLLSRVEGLADTIGLRSIPKVRSANENISPFVIGVIRPTLIFPKRLAQVVTPDVMDAMVLHELAHLKRGDLWIRWIQGLTRLVLFFWPPVRWVCRRIEKAMEQACDLWAIRMSGVTPQEYAQSLLELVRNIDATPVMTRRLAFAGKKSILEERFKMLLQRKNVGSSPRLAWVMVPGLFVWTIFALSGGTAAVGSEELHEKHEKSVQVKELIVKQVGDVSKVSLDVSIMPEADLDGSGKVTLAELEAYLDANPGAYELSVDPTEDGEGFTIRITQEMEGPHTHADHDMDWTRDVDEDHLVDVTETEEHGTKTIKIIKRRVGEGGETEELIEKELEIAGEHHEHDNVFVFKTEGHGEHAEGEERDVHMVYINSPEEFLEKHPEADVDGDGELSEAELETYASELAELQEVYISTSEHHLHGEHGEKEITVHIAEEHKGGENLIWVGEEGVASTDGKHVIIRKTISEDGKHVIVVKESDTELAQSTPTDRKKDFLADHPEADADGDGVISKQEAEAYAAKLQSERKKKE